MGLNSQGVRCCPIVALWYKLKPSCPGRPALKSATESHASPLLRSTDRQEELFHQGFNVLREAIAAKAFPGCAFAVLLGGKLLAEAAVGRFTYAPDSPLVEAETVYDLASVSKVMATSAMAMVLYERGQLDLDLPLVSVLPAFAAGDERRRQVTLGMLLAHSSGLPDYARLYEHSATRDELLRAALQLLLQADPGTRAVYSDIGFILLGEALARLADEPLDSFCRREIFGPLGMAHATFRPPAEWKPHIPPTVEDHHFRRRIVQGEVHDENASVMGGVSGHAGLFAAAYDVALFAHCMLRGGQPILRAGTVEFFTRRQTSPPGTCRALGWDTPSPPSQAGRHFSARAFGHLGYTGTSLWIDPERSLAIVLLTNRTWPDRSSQLIKTVRPQFHDAIVEALA